MPKPGPKPQSRDGGSRSRRLSIPLSEVEHAAIKGAAAAVEAETATWCRDVLLDAAGTKKETPDGE